MDIIQIRSDLAAFVKQEDGIDSLQVYRPDTGRTVWCIESLDDTMKADPENSPEFIAEHDYWTMLFPHES